MLSVQLISKFRPDLRRLKFCDRVCTQSKKFYEDILASLDPEMGAGKWCITFCVKMKKHAEISTYFCLKHRCGKKSAIFSVQCILTETM